jgi:1-acyl-sn-glycerol-3-phosphate acyltransferase
MNDTSPTNTNRQTRRIHFEGSRLANRLLKLFGWRVIFDGLPVKQGIIVAYPHTSNWDFVVAIMAKWSIGIPVHFWGKDSLFRIPLFGAWLRWLGGIPVARSNPQGIVEDMSAHIANKKQRDEYLWLALSPEGTRQYVSGWRRGFYRVALAAQLPVGVASLDWGKRTIRFTEFVELTGDEARDLQNIASIYNETYGGVKGRNAEAASPFAFISKSTGTST